MDFLNITRYEKEYFEDNPYVREICKKVEGYLKALNYYKTDVLPRDVNALYGKNYVPAEITLPDGVKKEAYPMVRADALSIGYSLFLDGFIKKHAYIGMPIYVIVKKNREYISKNAVVTEITENEDGIFVKVKDGGKRVWKLNDTATCDKKAANEKKAFFCLVGKSVPSDF